MLEAPLRDSGLIRGVAYLHVSGPGAGEAVCAPSGVRTLSGRRLLDDRRSSSAVSLRPSEDELLRPSVNPALPSRALSHRKKWAPG